MRYCTKCVMPNTKPFLNLDKNGIKAFRGSPEDKLDRYLQAARKYGIEFIVNVDGDDILCDPKLIDRTIEHYKKTGADCIDFYEERGLRPISSANASIIVPKSGWAMTFSMLS